MLSLTVKTATRSCLILGIFSVLAITGCATHTMPALTEKPTAANLPGKVVWHDLVTDTPEESKQFYGELFGWEFVDASATSSLGSDIDYTLIRLNGRLIGGLVDQSQLDTESDISQWISLISVADIEAATAAVSAGGGKVLSGPVSVSPRGRMAVVLDPEGALVSLVQTETGDPEDMLEIDAGAFLWNEVWTEDIDSAAEFYVQVAGYQPVERQALVYAGLDGRYQLLQSQDRPRVGIMQMPVSDLDPTWVSYLRVRDAASLDAIVARVEALGGTVLLDPQDRDLGGRVALISGPSGAGIALQTWPLEKGQ